MECLKKINFKLIGATILLVIGSFVISFASNSRVDRDWYDNLTKPSLNPPSWLFAPVWTFLYLSMGLASYLVYKAGDERFNGPAGIPLIIYVFQLLVNWSWPPIFFAFQQITLAFYVLVALDVCVITTLVAFIRLNWIAGLLFVPYLAWVSFATYLNYSLMVLNPDAAEDGDILT
uniref:Translocator protein n=1 Tax=Caligus clemensi TaxID=344056 RepID=C1C0C7_CALCM|nr:Translocator protein [Caligus clemensi]